MAAIFNVKKKKRKKKKENLVLFLLSETPKVRRNEKKETDIRTGMFIEHKPGLNWWRVKESA